MEYPFRSWRANRWARRSPEVVVAKESTLAVMQPTYLPWPGYFHLIARSDVFVFYDDAQFQRATFDQRNRILLEGNVTWLTVPVLHTGGFQRLCDARIDSSKDWRRRHGLALRKAYARAPFYSEIGKIIEYIETNSAQTLSELTVPLIVLIAELMGLSPTWWKSSELAVDGKRTDRLVALCRHFGCSTYLSASAGRAYLEADRFAERSGVALRFQAPPPIHDGKSREPLSVVDFLARLGRDQALDRVRNGHFFLN